MNKTEINKTGKITQPRDLNTVLIMTRRLKDHWTLQVVNHFLNGMIQVLYIMYTKEWTDSMQSMKSSHQLIIIIVIFFTCDILWRINLTYEVIVPLYDPRIYH